MKIRIRKVSQQERQDNPDRDYLIIRKGYDIANQQPAVLEQYDSFDCAWIPIEVAE